MESLPQKVAAMRHTLDGDFVAYLKYAVDREREALEAAGVDPDRAPSDWLQVLTVIQQGVTHELGKEIKDDVHAITWIMMMDHAGVRKQLTRITIDHLPAMDVRGFRAVARDIVANLAPRRGEVDDELWLKVEQFGRDLEAYLTDDKVLELSKPVDDYFNSRRDALGVPLSANGPAPAAAAAAADGVDSAELATAPGGGLYGAPASPYEKQQEDAAKQVDDVRRMRDAVKQLQKDSDALPSWLTRPGA